VCDKEENLEVTLSTVPDLCKNVSLLCCLVETVIHIQSLRSQICVYRHIFLQYRDAGREKEVKNKTGNVRKT